MSLRGTPASICFPMPLLHGAHCQEHLRISAPASSISATAAPSASSIFPMALRHGAPASHKPHSAEKSTPVWLAIWRIWAGFANSQLRYSAFATPNNICAHPSLLPHWAAAQTKQIFRPICTDCLRHLRISAERGYCLAGAQVFGVGYGCYPARCIVPANHRARL